MLAIKLWIVLLILMAPIILAEKCFKKFPKKQTFIKEMIDTQGVFCSLPVKILAKENVTDNCDLWALIHELDGLFEKLKFTDGTKFSKRREDLMQTFITCIVHESTEVTDAVNLYLQTVNMNPIQILQRINDSLHKLDGFTAEPGSSSECVSYYKKHGQNNKNATKGPQCVCSSPTTSISSSATSQTSLSYISEFASSTYTTSYSFHTGALAEDMSGSYPEKLKSPQKNPQGLDSSPFIFTDMPSDLKPLTTIMDHSHSGSTVQPGDYTNFPFTNPDFQIHSTEQSHVSLNPSQTRTDPEQVNKDTSNSDTEGMYKSVAPTTIENLSLSTYSLTKGDFSTVTEPDKIQGTTTGDFGSQSSEWSLFQNSLSVPSKEPVIKTNSISVTKIRRAVGNMDSISRAAVTTQAVSSLPTSANDPHHLTIVNSLHTNNPSSGMSLSTSDAPEPVSQGEVISDRNLGWASSYLSSTIMTTKTEVSMPSSVLEGQLFLSDVTRNPVLNGHKSYSILPQQEKGIAIDDRQNSFSGPHHNSNMLPIIATDPFKDRRGQEPDQSNLQLIIIIILVVLVLLFLCGFLYYMHQYRALKRRLNISNDLHFTRNPGAVVPEERVELQIIECDIV